MRKLAVILAVVLVVGLSAQSVFAVTLDPGRKVAKLRDWSNLFEPTPGGYTPRALTGLPPALGDENRSIFAVTQIFPTDSLIPDWNTSADEELTGLFYDLELIAIRQTGAVIELDFGPLGRNPLPGTPAGHGGVVEIYADTSVDFDPDPNNVGFLQDILSAPAPIATDGPTAWLDGAGVEVAGRDMYPTASDGTLWLSGAFVPIVTPGHAPGTVFTETLDLLDGSGTAGGVFKVLGGTYAGLIEEVEITANLHFPLAEVLDPGPDGIPFTADDALVMLHDVPDYDGLGYWQVDSDDPAHFEVIPEPGTMCLLGVGLLGLAIRRKK